MGLGLLATLLLLLFGPAAFGASLILLWLQVKVRVRVIAAGAGRVCRPTGSSAGSAQEHKEKHTSDCIRSELSHVCIIELKMVASMPLLELCRPTGSSGGSAAVHVQHAHTKKGHIRMSQRAI